MMSAKTKRIFKKTLLSILPISGIIILIIFILKLSAYKPDGTHINLGHMFDGILILEAIGGIVLMFLSLYITWFAKRFQWYVYLVNSLLFFALGAMAIDKFDSYSSAKQYEERERVSILSTKKIDSKYWIVDNGMEK